MTIPRHQWGEVVDFKMGEGMGKTWLVKRVGRYIHASPLQFLVKLLQLFISVCL